MAADVTISAITTVQGLATVGALPSQPLIQFPPFTAKQTLANLDLASFQPELKFLVSVVPYIAEVGVATGGPTRPTSGIVYPIIT